VNRQGCRVKARHPTLYQDPLAQDILQGKFMPSDTIKIDFDGKIERVIKSNILQTIIIGPAFVDKGGAFANYLAPLLSNTASR
jgi:hypothetical protein